MKQLQIVVVSYYDDNFGDMLIKICFRNLLRTALENLGIPSDEYRIQCMGLRQYRQELIAQANLICFAGGGLFGLSYLHFDESLSAILDIAEQKHTPVLFSSMGINHINSTEGSKEYLARILQHSCIHSISVRENLSLFQSTFPDAPVCQVCDPAVWVKEVYAKQADADLAQKDQHQTPVIGINVVRGGLFRDNGGEWGLSAELDFLNELRLLVEEQGYDYYFYTNGSTLDTNTLFALSNTHGIPMSKMLLVDSSAELVKTLAGFDAVVAIRMHSSILSYSLDVPVVNLVWNEKIPFLYQAIGYPEGAIPPEDWTAELVFNRLMEMMEARKANAQQDALHKEQYMMDLYAYLYRSLAEILQLPSPPPSYSFEQVCSAVCEQADVEQDDTVDMKFKIYEGERRYYNLFMAERSAKSSAQKAKKVTEAQKQKNAALKEEKAALKKENTSLNKQKKALQEKNNALSQMNKDLKKSNQSLDKKLTAANSRHTQDTQTIKRLTKRLNRIERNPFFRAGRKIHRILRKLKNLLKHS